MLDLSKDNTRFDRQKLYHFISIWSLEISVIAAFPFRGLRAHVQGLGLKARGVAYADFLGPGNRSP